MPRSKKSLVLLDFDGTLMADDIFAAFLQFRSREWRIRWRMIGAIPFFLAYKLKLMDNNKAKEKLFGRLFQGEPLAVFQAKARDFWRSRGTAINPLIALHLADHSIKGADLLIVSANFQPLLEAFCEREKQFKYIATELETKDALLTGKFRGANCYGPEKVRRIEAEIDRSHYDEVFAYGDSAGDLPMLSWADQAFFLKKNSFTPV